MDYEKKYNEALERARALWREAIEKEYVEDYLKDYETIFPELRESEDERILKGIIGKIDHDQTYGVSKAEMLSFLKSLRPPFKPSEEQMEALLWCIAHLGGADRRVLAELYEHLKMLNDGQITR